MTERINTILVDDEQNNLELLTLILENHCKQVNISGTFSDPLEALAQINRLRPDLVFLDIDMPALNGFELLKKLEPVSFEVIFVTAYQQYAADAFDYNAVAYLTKPLVTQKLTAAVERAEKRLAGKEQSRNIFSLLENLREKSAPGKIPLPTMQGLQFVKLEEICRCESSGNYTNFFFLQHPPVLVSRQLGEYEKLLPPEMFVRIHDRHIINLGCVQEYIKGSGGEIKMEDRSVIPVAARRKDEFLSRFDHWLRRK